MSTSSENRATTAVGVADRRGEIVQAVQESADRISRLVTLIVDVQPELAALPVTDGVWTVRDTLCHLAGYYPAEAIPEQIGRLRSLPSRTSPPRGAGFDIDAANERIRVSFDGYAVPEIAEVIWRGRAALVTAVRQLDAELLEQVAPSTPWGAGVPLWQVVLESTARHDAGHLAEMDEAVLGAEPVLYYQYLES